MAAKGPLDTKIDTAALNEIIVFANKYRETVKENSDEIKNICTAMQEEESLAGGDGEILRNNFLIIAQGCNQLDASTEYINKILNEKLAVAINMRHGQAVGNSTEQAQDAVKKSGVFKE